MSQPSSQSSDRSWRLTTRQRCDETSRRLGAAATALEPPTSPTLRRAVHKTRRGTIHQAVFLQYLTTWASNHDSSPYFHGSIELHPQSTISGEQVELGKSVKCTLTSANTTKNVVIRLFRSQQHSTGVRNQRLQEKKSVTVPHNLASCGSTIASKARNNHKIARIQQSQYVAPYKMVIRSGAGWVSAREYLDKHYFAHLARPEPRRTPREALGYPQYKAYPRYAASLPPAWMDFTADISWDPQLSTTPRPLVRNILNRTHSEDLGFSTSPRLLVTISPLFRPFLRLPLELQDAILYHAVGHTRCIRLTNKESPLNALLTPTSPKPPIDMSRLFRISKTINERMTPHIFRSTNFHFGITGFTKFLWQLGPINRSRLQHLTFHFGRGSLLHCIRWLAPDKVYRMFEPPVVTSPANLTYFWRCQLRDLMKELSLLTLTIDIRDVPSADVAMLVRILETVLGSVERIRLISNHVRAPDNNEECTIELPTRFRNLPRSTWRQLSLGYYFHYKREKFHMRQVWQVADIDVSPLMQVFMDEDKAFFDS